MSLEPGTITIANLAINGNHRSSPPQTGTTAQAAAVSNTENDTTQPSSILHAKLNVTPPTIVKAKGNYLTTSTGHQIFDATGGAAVSCLGHNHPKIKRAIIDQLDSIEYCYSPFFTTPASEKLAQHLTASTANLMSKIFIVSSGTEAIEAALKLARQYFVEKEGPQTKRHRFVGRWQSYHGNTLGALGVGGHKARRGIYEPFFNQNVFSHVSPCYPYRGMRRRQSEGEYVRQLAEELELEFQRLGPETVCAFVVETVAGLTLGAVTPLPGYLKAVREVCERHGVLLVLDEVMAGMGRTGRLHAWQWEEGFEGPDLQTVAKGLGAGYEPIGALLVHRDVVKVMEQGTGAFVHSQTYQGHPVACAAGLAVQRVIQEEELLKNVRELGPVLGSKLQGRLGGHRNVGDVRGRGFMWGIELVENKATKAPYPAEKRVSAMIHAKGLQKEFGISLLPGGGVADGTNGDVMMLAPAYNCSRDDIDLIVERTARVIEAVLGQ